MSRPRLMSMKEIAGTLMFQAKRGLTPEQGAAEMGVSYETWKKYLANCGGSIVTDRRIYMPESSINEDKETKTGAAG